MALRLSLRPHSLVKRQGLVVTGQANPYVCLRSEGGPPVFIQGGHFFWEGGDLCDEVPDWALEACKKLTKEVRKEVGLDKPTNTKANAEKA